jgi:DNA-binding CsgD family transcriptional regulator
MVSAGTATVTLRERRDALAAVEALAAELEVGGGRIALVEAGAGLGKTALLDACADQLAAGKVRVLRARGSDLERGFPYGIVRQLLAPVLRSEELYGSVLTGAASAARTLLIRGVAAEPAGAQPFEMMHALYWTVANLCDLGPAALLIDDVHDADTASLRLLSFVSRRLSDLPLLVVIAGRPVEGGDALADLDPSGVTTIPLQPLTEQGVAALLADGLGTVPDPGFTAACLEATGGNPFYLRELVREVLERGLHPSAEDARWIGGLGPAGIVGRTLFRMASLASAAVPLARALAVLGDGAELWPCARLAGISLDEAATAADALVRGGILAPGSRLAFLHPILQSAVLSDLGDHSRRLWHARAARILDEAGAGVGMTAQHLLHADATGDRRAREILVQAGRAAAREGSPAAAAQLLRRAADELPEPPDADLRFELGFAHASLDHAGGIDLMASGVRDTADPAEQARRALRLANFQMRSGHLAEAVQLLGAARAGVQDDEELVLALDATRYWAGRLGAAPDDAERLRRELPFRLDGPDTPARRATLAYLACEAAQTRSADEAASLFDRALRPPGLLEFVRYDAVAVQASMLSLAAIERHAEFDQLVDAVLDEAGRRGHLLAFLVVSAFRAMALLRQGDLGGAEAEAREALASATEQGWWQPGSASLPALRALALLEQGDVAGAEQALAEADRMQIAPGFPAAVVLRARGRLRAEQGDVDGGVACLLECGATLERMQVHSPGVLPWRSDAALILAGAGEPQRSRELAETELGLARRLAGPIAVARALHALAQSTRGRERIGLLREAYAPLAHPAANLTRARVAVDLGATLRRERHAEEARRCLAEGLELALRCGCTPLAERAQDELAVAGGVPHHSPMFGRTALTPSELRVARLAAAGRTNAEIAQRLFVTRKTVEKHLAGVYRKLGIDSRAQLDPAQLAPS